MSPIDGTTADLFIIPAIVTISLALGIVMVYWADSHPRRRPPAGKHDLKHPELPLR